VHGDLVSAKLEPTAFTLLVAKSDVLKRGLCNTLQCSCGALQDALHSSSSSRPSALQRSGGFQRCKSLLINSSSHCTD
jgi:hypothetical protein